jgi:hypothetical protein
MTDAELSQWREGLKPGDEVMVTRFNEPLRLRRVRSVTKGGRIRVARYTSDDFVEFNADGTVRGERSAQWSRHMGEWERTELAPATDELKAKLKALREERELENWRSGVRQHLVIGVSRDEANALTDDQLRAVEAILWPLKSKDAT